MQDEPETRYAWVTPDVAVAYQVVGDGPVDVVYLQGYASNVDMNWQWAPIARFLEGLAGISRLIVMDLRGQGCPSGSHLPTCRRSRRSWTT